MARLTSDTVGVAHRRLAVGDLLGHAHDLAPQREGVALHGGAHALGLHLERAPGAGPAGQGGVDGEVHGGIEEEGVDAGLGDPVRVAGQVGRA